MNVLRERSDTSRVLERFLSNKRSYSEDGIFRIDTGTETKGQFCNTGKTLEHVGITLEWAVLGTIARFW